MIHFYVLVSGAKVDRVVLLAKPFQVDWYKWSVNGGN